MPRPLVAQINISALKHNLAVARNCARQAKILAVVKANAYGHGLEHALKGFANADGLGLIEIDAAVRLRRWGWRKRIVLLEGFFDQSDIDIIAAHQIETVVHCRDQLAMLEQCVPSSQLNVHLKMNSGMNRLGFRPDAYRETYQRLRSLPAVRHISHVTHFANADDAANTRMSLAEQLARFQEATRGLPGERSLANSATDLMHPECAADWVRPGIMLYGATPSVLSAEAFGLRPAMTLCSEIIGIQHIAAGESVGYGSQFVADTSTIVGVVACGYADGYPRHAPTGTPVLVAGVKTRTIGRVSMDMITVDLTMIENVHVGMPVTLWGVGLPIDEVANAAGTVGYELMCAVAPRVRMIEVNTPTCVVNN